MATLTPVLARHLLPRSRLRPGPFRPQQRRLESSTPTKKPKTDKEAIVESPAVEPPAATRPSFWQRLGPLTTAAGAYARAQRKRPYATQFGTTLVIYFVADINAQYIGGHDYEVERTGRSLLIGGGASIPFYMWVIYLSTNFNYASKLLSLATKVVVNQIFFAPVINSYFFGAQALLSGSSIHGAFERIKTTLPTSLINGWKLWPAVTAFTFTFVPMQYRSVFSSVIAMGWQTYLIFLNRTAEQQEEQLEATVPTNTPGSKGSQVASAA